MHKYLIGTDIGTTGAKSTVFDIYGAPVAGAYREYSCVYPKPLWVEQDAKTLFSAAVETIKEAVEKSGVAKSDIAAIGFSTQRSCALFLDGEGELLKMISWQDSRCGDTVRLIDDKIGSERFYESSGVPLGSTWVLPKILWLREHDKELFGKTKRVVQLHDYILREFGADGYYTSETDAGMSGMYDVNNHKWNDEITAMFNIDRPLLPEVRQAGSGAGVISDNIAEYTGLPKGLPLYIGAGDISASAIGAGVVSDGDFLVSMGTGGMMVAVSDTPSRDPNGAFLITNHASHGKWQWEGLQKGSAGIYRWFRDEIASLEYENAKKSGTNVYDSLSRLIKDKKISAGANGLLVLPFFASAGTPRWNNNAKGCVIGLTFAHGKADMARAFMEGAVLEFEDMFKSLERSGITPSRVRISGGPTKSDLWNSIHAGIYNMPVETLEFADASVMGAAMTGAVGCGIYGGFEQAAKNMVRPAKLYYPDKDEACAYKELYNAYCAAYEGLAADAFDILAKL